MYRKIHPPRPSRFPLCGDFAPPRPLGNLLGLGGCIFRYIPPLGSVRIHYGSSSNSSADCNLVSFFLALIIGVQKGTGIVNFKKESYPSSILSKNVKPHQPRYLPEMFISKIGILSKLPCNGVYLEGLHRVNGASG